MRFLFVFLVAVSLISSIPDFATAEENPWFPLTQGWRAQYTGNIAAPPFIMHSVVGQEMFYGQMTTVMEIKLTDLGGNVDRNYGFYSVGADGDLFFHGFRIDYFGELQETVFVPPYRLVDMPATPGHAWTDAYTEERYADGQLIVTRPGIIFNGEVASQTEAVTVPAGTFAATAFIGTVVLPADLGGQHQRTARWLVEGVGMVQREFSMTGFPGSSFTYLWTAPIKTEGRSFGSLKAGYAEPASEPR